MTDSLRRVRAVVEDQFHTHYEIFEELCTNGSLNGRSVKKSSLRHALAHDFHERCKAYQDVLEMIDAELAKAREVSWKDV